MSDALQRLIEAVEAASDAPFHELTYSDLDGFGQRFINLVQQANHGDLNAAKALHGAMLAGWRMKIEQEEIVALGDAFTACVWPNDPSRREQVFRPFGKSDDPARAWLLAILRAYQQVQA